MLTLFLLWPNKFIFDLTVQSTVTLERRELCNGQRYLCFKALFEQQIPLVARLPGEICLQCRTVKAHDVLTKELQEFPLYLLMEFLDHQTGFYIKISDLNVTGQPVMKSTLLFLTMG